LLPEVKMGKSTKLNRMDAIQMLMTANAELNALEDEIVKRLKGTLEVYQEKERVVGCAFDRGNYQMKIYVDEREYAIGVQGRGTDINKYLGEMIEILKEEVKH